MQNGHYTAVIRDTSAKKVRGEFCGESRRKSVILLQIMFENILTLNAPITTKVVCFSRLL